MSNDDTVSLYEDLTDYPIDYDFDYCTNQRLEVRLEQVEARTLHFIQNSRNSPTPWLRRLLIQVQHVLQVMFQSRLHMQSPSQSDDETDDSDEPNELDVQQAAIDRRRAHLN